MSTAPSTVRDDPPTPWLIGAALLAGGCYLLARSMRLGPASGPWGWWPVVGLMTGIFYRRPTREWWGLGAAAAAGQVLTIWVVRGDLAHGATVAGALANVAQSVLGALILQKAASRETPLGGAREFACFIIGAVCLAPLIITPFMALTYAAGLHLSFASAWWPLFVGDALSVLLFAPLTLNPLPRVRQANQPWSAGPWEVALCLFSILAVSVLAFGDPQPRLWHLALPFLMFPLLAWAALRCGPSWTGVAIVIVATVSAWGTARGRGPFAGRSVALEERLLHWDEYVTYAALAALLLSTLTEERRRAYAELALRDAIQRAVFESSTALIALKDLDQRYVLVNGAVEQILGKPREELIGQNCAETMTPADAAMVHQHDRRVLERGEALTFEEPLCLHGQRRHLVMTRFPVRGPDGQIRYVALIGRDESAQRELLIRLRQTGRVGLLGQLAAGLAHDLNNLLSVVSTNAALLRESHALSGEDAEMIEQIGQAGDRAAALTRRLLSLGREKAAPRTPVEVDEVLRALEPMLRAYGRGNVDLASRLNARGASVLADRTELEQIVLNLFINARDAIPDVGRICIETSVGPPSLAGGINGTPVNAVLRLAVTDSGIGMEEATRARLFEPFFTTKAEAKGTGLGLYTTSLLVREAGGAIHATSAPGNGSTFVVELPLANSPG